MDTNTVIGGLVAAIVAMGGLFTFILKDERQRVKDLLSRLDEKDKVVFTAVDVLAKAVETVKSQGQFYEAIQKLNDAKEALGGQKQLYEAISKIDKAIELLRPNKQGGGDDR